LLFFEGFGTNPEAETELVIFDEVADVEEDATGADIEV
jgi:hypothetical protein